jgi:prolipoprotein diacylglyceryltransferase
VFGTAMATYSWFKRRLPVGVTGLIWLSIYAAGRFLLSYLRKDPLFLGLRQAQWASLAMILASVIAIAIWARWPSRQSPEPASDDEQEGAEAAAV